MLRCPLNPKDIVRITDRFEPPRHYGIDLSCVVGTPIYAMASGIIYGGSQSGGFGLYTRLETDGLFAYVAHMSRVLTSGPVKRGELIGYSGNTGNSTGPHAHIEIRVGSHDSSAAVDPEPLIDWETEEDDMLTTLHFQRVPDWANGVLAEWRSGWVKIVNPSPVLSFPDVPRLLVRFWTDDRDAAYLAQGRGGGAQFVRDMVDQWLAIPGATAFELANEPDCNSNDGLARLCQYTLGAIEQANARGLKLCILNLPEGNPNGDHGAITWKWQQLLPAVQAAVAGGHCVGMHAYWRPGVEGPTGRYHALGRRAYDIQVLGGLGIDTSRLKVLVNECGIDGGIAGHTGQQGWRNLSNPDAYRAEIAEAERYARTVTPIQALMLFTAGFEQPWGGYDIDQWFAQSCTGPLRAVADEGGYVIPADPEDVTVDITAAQFQQARERLAVYPASMKACDDAGLKWCTEWRDGDAVLVLAYDPLEQYLVLRLNPQTWEVEAEASL